MNENPKKIFTGLDTRGGELNDIATPLCANVDVRGTELRSRNGYQKVFMVGLGSPIMGIFNYITKYLEYINIPRVATIIDSDYIYSDVYSDGSYIWTADGNGTRLRLLKYDNGATTEYTLSGDYNGDLLIFEFDGSLRIAIDSGTTLRIVTFDGSSLSLTDSTATSGTIFGVFVSSIMSLVYLYGNNGFNYSFDGSGIADGPAIIVGTNSIHGYTETATNIYLIHPDGYVQTSSGGAWSLHATGVYVDPIWSNSVVSGVDYMVCVYSVGDTNYGIYTYNGTTLSRIDSRRYSFGATDGTNFCAIDNSVFLYGSSPSSMLPTAYITTPQSAYGMRMAILNGVAYIVGGRRSVGGIMAVRL